MKEFPTMLRKMWSGGEVQEWLNENIKPSVEVSKLEELIKAREYSGAYLPNVEILNRLQKLIDDNKE